eukprot:g1089.t1
MELLVTRLFFLVTALALAPAQAKEGRVFLEGAMDTAAGLTINNHQMPAPSTTQLLRAGQTDEWISLTPGGLYLLDNAGVEREWPGEYSGYPSTGFGGDSFSSTSYGSHFGDHAAFPGKGSPPRAMVDVSYTSYFVRKAMELGTQSFFFAGNGLYFLLPGCPTYEPSDCEGGRCKRAGAPAGCPRKQLKPGEFKFSILGLLSGTDVNSLSAMPPKGARPNNAKAPDLAQFKTLIYRTVIDVGGMGRNASAHIKHRGKNGTKPLARLALGEDVAGADLVVEGAVHGSLGLHLDPFYSSGTFTRNMSNAKCTEHAPGSSGFEVCSSDNTGYDPAPDSAPQTYMPKAGRKGVDSEDAIAGMNAAPKLTVGEVRKMKVTLRPAVCDGRPRNRDKLASKSQEGRVGGVPKGDADAWLADAALSQGCPGWYRQYYPDHGSPGTVHWFVDVEYFRDSSSGSLKYTPAKDDISKCERGSCYLMDFHIDLGGRSRASRTLFGNPANDAANGLERGTFFMYDPTAFVPGDVGASTSGLDNGAAVALGALGALAAVGAAAGFVHWRRRRRGYNAVPAPVHKEP